MVDLQKITATLWRYAEDEMRSTFGNPGTMANYIPMDTMDDYERDRHQAVENVLRFLLDDLTTCVNDNLAEFKNGQLPSCLRSKNCRG